MTDPPKAPASTAQATFMETSTMATTPKAARINSTVAPMVPARSAFSGEALEAIRTSTTPMTEQIRPTEARARGMNISAGRSPSGSIMSAAMVAAMAMVAIMAPTY